MKKLTSRTVRRFWDYMSEHYATTVLRKDDDLIQIINQARGKNILGVLSSLGGQKGDEIGLVALFLDKIDMVNVQDFMEKFSTTLGDRIYIPFEPGEETENHSLAAQVRICVHEHQHVLQYRDEPISFIIRYLADRAQRTIFEAEAFRSSLEIDWFLSEGQATVGRAESFANGLVSYGCTDTDIAVAKKHLRMSFKTVQAGGVINPTSKVALRWLEKNV